VYNRYVDDSDAMPGRRYGAAAFAPTKGTPLEHIATHASCHVFALGRDITVTRVTAIGQKVRDFIRSHPDKDLVLDLSKTEFIDSSGINLLVNIDKNLKASGRKVHMLRPGRAVLDVFHETHLDAVFSILEQCDDVAGAAVSAYETYCRYAAPEGDALRLKCTCPACSSPHVVGYLVDTASLAWSWEEGALLPASVLKDSETPVDFFSLRPIICMECFMASTDVTHFGAAGEGQDTVASTLSPKTIAALARGSKRRKDIMSIGRAIGDVFFEMPRSGEATCQAYLLAAECARAINMRGSAPCPSALGAFYYCAFAYAEPSQKDAALNNSRAWLTRVLQDRESFSPLECARASFMLINVSLSCEKNKEAAAAFAALSEETKDVQPCAAADINDPCFWLEGAKIIAEKNGIAAD